jgi:isoquinoline 1-oxidoreductase beta subunit
LVVGFGLWPRNYPNRWPLHDGETLLNSFVKVGVDGRVTVAVPQAEMGQGVFSGLAQIVADELGADWLTVGVEPAPLHPDYAATGLVAAARRRCRRCCAISRTPWAARSCGGSTCR